MQRRRCWGSPLSFATRNDPDLRGTAWAWLAYVLGTAVALLAHNTAVFLPIGANVLMLGWWWAHGRGPRGFLRNWLLAQVAVLGLWAGWLPAYLQQVAHGGAYAWIPRPNVGGVISGAYAVYAGVTRATPYPLEAVVILALGGLGLWSWKNDRRWIAFVLVFALSAPLGELIVSLWRPIFLAQTLIWSAVPLTSRRRGTAVPATARAHRRGARGLIVLGGLGLRSYYFLHDKEAWDQVAAYVDRHVQRGDAIVFSVGFLQIPFDHYYSAPSGYSVQETGSRERRTTRSSSSRRRRRAARVADRQPPQGKHRCGDRVVRRCGSTGRARPIHRGGRLPLRISGREIG